MSEGEVDRELIERLAGVLHALLVAGAEHWAGMTLTMPQLKVLLILGERGGARVSWLAEQMAVSAPNITGILDRLERRGWITRTADRVDRRVVRVVLSDAGHQVIAELCAASAARCEPRLRRLSAGSRRELIHALDRLAAALGNGVVAGGDTGGAQVPEEQRGQLPQRAQKASARS
ncbi:MAG TPA: MarR family transcriptional regulator [Dehalococcoidia bacterium]|nr:MarR family transcriptional regulator [Dehalococcoidia bacterium]